MSHPSHKKIENTTHPVYKMSMPPELLPILRCPVSGQPLSLSTDGLLVRADGKTGYPIENGIPILLPDHAIPCKPSSSKN